MPKVSPALFMEPTWLKEGRMAKYEVIRPWHGVEMGQIIEVASLHPALLNNVRMVPSGTLTPAVDEERTTRKYRKQNPETE